MTSINSVCVLNPKLNHRLSLPHSPIFHPLLKHNHTFKLSLPLNQPKPLTVTFVAPQHDDSDHGEVELEKMNADIEELVREFDKVLGDVIDVISIKTIANLKDVLDWLKIQVDKAKHHLTVMEKEITDKGKENFSSDTEKAIVVETFTSPDDDLSNVSGVPEFYVGIPYGLILSVGGFLSFMITGSIAAIRFGVILGSVLLALSIVSVQSYKKGHPSFVALAGQTVIASILFLREIRSVGRGSTYFTAVISGAVAAFYVYRLVLVGKTRKGSNLEGEAEN